MACRTTTGSTGGSSTGASTTKKTSPKHSAKHKLKSLEAGVSSEEASESAEEDDAEDGGEELESTGPQFELSEAVPLAAVTMLSGTVTAVNEANDSLVINGTTVQMSKAAEGGTKLEVSDVVTLSGTYQNGVFVATWINEVSGPITIENSQ